METEHGFDIEALAIERASNRYANLNHRTTSRLYEIAPLEWQLSILVYPLHFIAAFRTACQVSPMVEALRSSDRRSTGVRVQPRTRGDITQ